MFTRSQDSPATEFSNTLSLAKRHLKKGGQTVCLIFLYGIEILATLIEYFQMFSSLTMQKKFNIADHYRLA